MSIPSNKKMSFARCPICEAKPVFENSKVNRLCYGCRSVERQRIFYRTYINDFKADHLLNGKRGLLISPSVSELKMFEKISPSELITIDIRPEVKADICADISKNIPFEDNHFDFIYASYVLTCLKDLKGALKEFYRVLTANGLLLTIDPLYGKRTKELKDIKQITTYYGKDTYDKFSVGVFRQLGGEDLNQVLSQFFEVTQISNTDGFTDMEMSLFISKKLTSLNKERDLLKTAVKVKEKQLKRQKNNEKNIIKAEQLWAENKMESTSEALKLFQQLFDQGEIHATAYRLGTAYYLGKGVEKDLEKAYKYLSLDNSRYALYYRGLILSDSNFSGINLQLAFKTLSEALKMGVPHAQIHIDKILDKVSCLLLEKQTNAHKKEEIPYWPTYCLVCNQLMEKLVKKDKCPHCESASRTRNFPIVMDALKNRISHNLTTSRPLLGFALTSPERAVLSTTFPMITSASLYGNYGGNHIEGCDVRDLSRFADGYFCGVFSILLFDYFTEIDVALAECARVTGSGGVFITHIANSRLVDGELTPTITSVIKKTETYFPYIPDDANMPSIKLGRQTFINAMKRAGYQAAHYSIQDEASGENTDWFIGFLPDFKEEEHRVQRKNESFVEEKVIPLNEKTYCIPLKDISASNFKHGRSKEPFLMSLRLSVPKLPKEARFTDFAEHVYDRKSKSSTAKVILAGRSIIVESRDNGASWIPHHISEIGTRRLFNCFTTDEGNHIVQAVPEDLKDSSIKQKTNPARASLFLFDQDWNLLSVNDSPEGKWHGRASIDQSDNTIMFAEYYDNVYKYHPDYKNDYKKWYPLMKPCKVFRSRDGGHTWEVVFEVFPDQIRHLHTLQADPFLPKTWWLSSGDRAEECHVWRSDDDGDSWINVTNQNPQIILPPAYQSRSQAAFRYTDLIINQDSLMWGSDDILGLSTHSDSSLAREMRTGSRIYRTPKSNPLQIEELGYIGHPVRSIVDVGPAYIFITEANLGYYPLRPQVVALFKDDMSKPIEIARLDNFQNKRTGFSYSKASKTAFNGRFFSFRNSTDVFNNILPRILQWDVEFNE